MSTSTLVGNASSVAQFLVTPQQPPTTAVVTSTTLVGAAAAATLNPAQIYNGVVQGTVGANATFTLPGVGGGPRGADLVLAALGYTPGNRSLLGQEFKFTLQNLGGANTITLANSADGTITVDVAGLVAVAAGSATTYRCFVTAAGVDGGNNSLTQIAMYGTLVYTGPNAAYTIPPFLPDVVVDAAAATGALAYTTSTAAQILGALGWTTPAFIGKRFEFIMEVPVGQAITLTAGAGVSIVGNAITNDEQKTVKCVVTQAGAVSAITMAM